MKNQTRLILKQRALQAITLLTVAMALPNAARAQQSVGRLRIGAPSGPDIQINDPSLDNIQYPNENHTTPWEFATESETTIVTDGANIVVSYNSTANQQIVSYSGNASQGTAVFAYQFIAAYSVSHDGGQTWKSGFFSPSQGSTGTGFDSVLAKDRAGNFYCVSQGQDAAGNPSVIVGKSTDHGDTFGTAQTVALDPGRDKDGIAVGPDPGVPARDNIYVAWVSFSSSLVFSRSLDGGVTWSAARTMFSYADDGVLSSYFQLGPLVVDQSNGRLYVAFVHFGHWSGIGFRVADYIRVLVSDDGGNSFYPLSFNIPGAPNQFVYPKVSAGILADEGLLGSDALPVIKQGPDIGGGYLSQYDDVPRYVHCSRNLCIPTCAAQNGHVVIASDASTGATVGAPTNQSQIIALYSQDGGATWLPPFVVAQATASDPQHIIPSIALTPNGNTAYVGYYVQDSNEQVRTELATLQLTRSGLQLLSRKPLSSVRFDLTPNNVPSPFPPLKSKDSANFDFGVQPGYDLGEYMAVVTDPSGNPLAAWGDCRNTWVSPANGVYPGPHPKTDVFFVKP